MTDLSSVLSLRSPPSGSFEDVLICGALLMMGVYHLVIFALRRRDAAAPFLALFCMFGAVSPLCLENDGLGLASFLPGFDPETALDACMIDLMLAALFLLAFFRALFPRRFPMVGLHAFAAFALACGVAGLVFGFHGPVLLTTHLFFVVALLHLLINLCRACAAGDNGAIILSGGVVILGLCAMNDVLLGEKLISSVWLTPVGVMVFVLAQSGLLAHRFSQALTTSERLSSRLEAEIGHRTALQRKLDSVVDEERRFVSRALHDGLCQDLTAARLHCALWRSSSSGGTEAFRKVSELLERSVDQAYELSRGLWPADQDIADLPGALRDLGATVSAEHGLAVTVRCEAGRADFSESEREHIFQIAKEALKNVVKHAKACHASVELRSEGDGGPLLVVEDDGVGLAAGAPVKGGLGRRIMSHHAQAVGGVLALSSRPEGGARIELSVPRPRAYV
jgi:signal transduction histidine kinase